MGHGAEQEAVESLNSWHPQNASLRMFPERRYRTRLPASLPRSRTVILRKKDELPLDYLLEAVFMPRHTVLT